MTFVYGAITFFGRHFHGRSTRQIAFYGLPRASSDVSTLQPQYM